MIAELAEPERAALRAAAIASLDPTLRRYEGMVVATMVRLVIGARSADFEGPVLPDPEQSARSARASPAVTYRTDVALRMAAMRREADVIPVAADAILGLGDMRSGDYYRMLLKIVVGTPLVPMAAALYDEAERMVPKPGRIPVPVPPHCRNPGAYFATTLRKEIVALGLLAPADVGTAAQKTARPGHTAMGPGRAAEQQPPLDPYIR